MKVKVPVFGTVNKMVRVDPDATNGAVLGVNLFNVNGTVVSATDMLAFLGISGTGSGGVTAHRLLEGLNLGDDHPQYTRKDTLTTQGDLYIRGATTVERLGIGATGTYPRSNGTTLAYSNFSEDAQDAVGGILNDTPTIDLTYNDALGTITADVDLTATFAWTGAHSFSTTPTVPNDSWTYAKIQNVSATSRLLGRITSGAGDIEELTGTQATTMLDVFTSALKGLVPASGGGTTNFLRADGTFAAPPSATGGYPPQLGYAGI